MSRERFVYAMSWAVLDHIGRSRRETARTLAAGSSAARAACDTRAVSTLDALGRELQSAWQREIPLAAAIAIEVASCTREELVVRAPLAPNRNLHGTAFAGSLFSICVLAGWGATWLALEQRGLSGAIVVADSRIRYRKAVSGEILCRCRPDLAVVEQRLSGLATSGRAALPLACTIDQDDKHAVAFDGEYVVRAQNESHAHV